MKNFEIALLSMVLFSAENAFAQPGSAERSEDKWDAYGNLGYSFEGRTGVEIEAGVKYRPVSWIEFGASPANLIFYENEDDHYQRETFSNGGEVCRDTTNGQFADDARCAPDVAWRGLVTGELNLGPNVSAGGGYLFGDQEAGFGSLRYNFSNRWALQGRVGSEYGSLAVSLRF
ncbi:hypothetical protein ACQKH5_11005 [Hyphomonas sp. NPDC076900]|uniref:hypothetical protein n=1 Tax=unclassified Hyphomonas TaxID=2630699 RepID=UPI003CFF2887